LTPARKSIALLHPLVSKGKIIGMKKLKLELGSCSYEIQVGFRLLEKAGDWLKKNGYSGKVVVITDTTVGNLYANALSQSLNIQGFKVVTLEVPPGEQQKSLENAGVLYQQLADSLIERNTPILALGGGVIGDLAGFVAATYMRGVPLIQIPTTLLAQVDSSIGGKVAVDHAFLKNIVGAFYQPQVVFSDIHCLETLPEVELVNGMAEVIKSAAIKDSDFFGFLEANLARAGALDMKVLEKIVIETAGIKAGIVSQDEKDTGLRNILNFGHTVGHALETVSGFQLKHGQAVAIGMIAAARISNRLGFLNKKGVSSLTNLIQKAGLPTDISGYDIREIISIMKHDKKVKQDKIRFILLKAIGEAVISDDVSPGLVEEVLVDWK
jgi:3-dehydroquinate synthase